MKSIQKILILVLFLFAWSCKEKYLPVLQNVAPTGYLVIDGFINSGPGPTTISLSRTTKISSPAGIVHEGKALVRVENEGNTSGFVLKETTTGSGIYTYPQLVLVPNERYRLYIKTSFGKEYVSDYSEYRATPDIDSLSWHPERDGVQIYTNAHTVAPATGFYRFTYDETWEFQSRYATRLKLIYNARRQPLRVAFRDSSTYDFDLSLYTCWKYDTSFNIQIYSTEKLDKNVVSLYPTKFIEPADWRLGIRYSINVHMYAISKRGYQFLEQLKKNTELLGTIFDPQPSDNNGNMTCLTNTAEPVIGFIEISQEKMKRIFINNSEVPGWMYQKTCDPDIVVPNDSLAFTQLKDQIPTDVYDFDGGGGIMDAFFAEPICVDCRLRGVNVRPPFW